ncbi:MAG: hypothetical protein HYT08_04025 [Candidatus Levybacteria bacterium]|nr:hypothetical protein [Candidatus Levybacteria bacterium]
MKILLQSLLLLLSFILVFIWQQSPLANYTIQIIGFLIFIYVVSTFAGTKKIKMIFLGGPLSVFILNTIILLFIFSTGSIASSFFFLLYFVVFALVFVFDPITIAVFCASVIMVFLPDALKDDVTGNFIRLGSLLLVSPIAFLFGREYQKGADSDDHLEKEKVEGYVDEIEDTSKDLLEKETPRSPEEIIELKNIVSDAEKIRDEIS